LSSLLLNNYSTFVDRLKEECGDRSCSIWLFVNPKYPEDITNIWDPIMYEIQDKVYRKLHARINSKKIFIKNAVSDIGRVTDSSIEAEVAKSIVTLRESLLEYQPKLLITFGTIAFEFVRRVTETRPENGTKYWNSCNLGNAFEHSIENFDISQANSIPLVRRMSNSSINNKDWEDSNSYFHNVADKIADKIIEHKDSLNIWI